MCTISVQLDALAALADELTALAAELGDDAPLCRAAGASLHTALDGDEGWTSAGAARAWGSLAGLVAARTGAVAATLTAATDAYRAADRALSDGIARRPGTAPE